MPIFFNFLVDCIWGEWKEGKCSKSCGGGSRTDERSKESPEKNGGTCEGESTRTVRCNEQNCLTSNTKKYLP